MMPSSNVCTWLAQREYGHKVTLDNYAPRRIKKNIEANDCFKTIYNCNAQIESFHAEKNFAVTLDRNETVQLWNLEKRICLWIHQPKDCYSFNSGHISIVDKHVIYAGNKYSKSPLQQSLQPDRVIRILDLQTGKSKGLIQASFLNIKLAYVTGESIFTSIRPGETITEWDFTGKCVRHIKPPDLQGKTSNFLATNNFMIHFGEKNFIIQHRTDHAWQRDFDLCMFPQFKDCYFSSATLENGYLICVICSLASEKKVWVLKMNPEKNMATVICNESDLPETDFNLSTMVPRNHVTYLFENGIFPLRFPHEIQNEQEEEKDFLTDDLFADLSKKDQLRIWNLPEQKLIATKDIKGYKNCMITSGKILAIAHKSLIQWDYFMGIPGEGEKLTEGSPANISPLSLSFSESTSDESNEEDETDVEI